MKECRRRKSTQEITKGKQTGRAGPRAFPRKEIAVWSLRYENGRFQTNILQFLKNNEINANFHQCDPEQKVTSLYIHLEASLTPADISVHVEFNPSTFRECKRLIKLFGCFDNLKF